MKNLLTVAGLTKRFSGPPVVNDLTFSVRDGEIFALLGPSGCGKSTTLRLIAGFERPDAGEVWLEDRLFASARVHIPAEQRGIGLVFQDFALFPHLSVYDNVKFGLRSMPREKIDQRCRELIQLVGLTGFEKRMPHQLSGGQQQRVAIARSLAPAPRLVLLDEPFSNLDALLRQATRQEFRGVLKRSGMTAVIVTHDQEEALSFADRVAVMRSGHIEQIGTPEEVYYQPRTLFVAQFLGRTNLLLSEADGMRAHTPVGTVALNRNAQGNVLLSLRPEHLTLEAAGPDENGSAGQVIAREFKGHDITFRVLLAGSEYLVHTNNRMPFQPGDRVYLRALEPAVVLEGQTPVPQ
ncbi:MAG: ABC transporter ATP-binding protein [Rhodothermales bacterium]